MRLHTEIIVMTWNNKKGYKMTIQKFIQENREELDNYIKSITDRNERLNNEERHLWILNDENLYRWARSQGVRI